MANKTKRLTESAMLLAMAIVLELVSKMFIPEMPFGGQITLVSMLPVGLLAYRDGGMRQHRGAQRAIRGPCTVRLHPVLRLGRVVLHPGGFPRMGCVSGGKPQPHHAGLCVQFGV